MFTKMLYVPSLLNKISILVFAATRTMKLELYWLGHFFHGHKKPITGEMYAMNNKLLLSLLTAETAEPLLRCSHLMLLFVDNTASRSGGAAI